MGGKSGMAEKDGKGATGGHRFSDQNTRLSDVDGEVWVCCPSCGRQALARRDDHEKRARLICPRCGYQKEASTLSSLPGGSPCEVILPAHAYFDARLWFSHPFKNDLFWAYNPAHLDYLEQYISAKLREHRDRTHFTLLEKLPTFYHESRNRGPLLKLIAALREK